MPSVHTNQNVIEIVSRATDPDFTTDFHCLSQLSVDLGFQVRFASHDSHMIQKRRWRFADLSVL